MSTQEIIGSQTESYVRSASKFERIRRKFAENLIWYIFVAPAVIMIAVFMVVPIVQSLSLALYEWNGVLPRESVGFENFQDLLDDRFFLWSLRHTFIFSTLATTGTVLVGLLLALAISRQVPGSSVYRVLFYLPVMVPITVVGALWARILEPRVGPLNSFLNSVGLDALAKTWLGDIDLALYVIIAVTIWQYAGFPMIVLLAAIENIGEDIQEAATLDGISEW